MANTFVILYAVHVNIVCEPALFDFDKQIIEERSARAERKTISVDSCMVRVALSVCIRVLNLCECILYECHASVDYSKP